MHLPPFTCRPSIAQYAVRIRVQTRLAPSDFDVDDDENEVELDKPLLQEYGIFNSSSIECDGSYSSVRSASEGYNDGNDEADDIYTACDHINDIDEEGFHFLGSLKTREQALSQLMGSQTSGKTPQQQQRHGVVHMFFSHELLCDNQDQGFRFKQSVHCDID